MHNIFLVSSVHDWAHTLCFLWSFCDVVSVPMITLRSLLWLFFFLFKLVYAIGYAIDPSVTMRIYVFLLYFFFNMFNVFIALMPAQYLLTQCFRYYYSLMFFFFLFNSFCFVFFFCVLFTQYSHHLSIAIISSIWTQNLFFSFYNFLCWRFFVSTIILIFEFFFGFLHIPFTLIVCPYHTLFHPFRSLAFSDSFTVANFFETLFQGVRSAVSLFFSFNTSHIFHILIAWKH